ncbi:MAG: TetR/AcrR family transcriptional regulator, partial [Vicinamibacteria bacterium]
GGVGVPIADLMRELRLTHGGFYRHFRGKEQLFEEALLASLAQAAAKMKAAAERAPAGHELEAIITAYLSAEHCANPADGCPVAALAAEIARLGKSTRAALDRALRDHAAALSRFMPGDSSAERKRTAMVLFAGMAGALNLARAAADESLRQAILEDARAFYVRILCQRS